MKSLMPSSQSREERSVLFDSDALLWSIRAYSSFCVAHKEILPTCYIRPTYGDTVQLAEEVLMGTVDAVIVMLPLKHSDLYIEELRRHRLVVCLRIDNPLPAKLLCSPLISRRILPFCITRSGTRCTCTAFSNCLPVLESKLKSIPMLPIRRRCKRSSNKVTALH
jgi:DNA-binding transcriptional LysR family regulator